MISYHFLCTIRSKDLVHQAMSEKKGVLRTSFPYLIVVCGKNACGPFRDHMLIFLEECRATIHGSLS